MLKVNTPADTSIARTEGLQSGGRRMPVRAISRIGGLLYLIIIVGGAFGEGFIRGQVVVPGNPAAMAANLREMESLWRIGIALEFFMLTCTVALTAILFIVLRPVNRDLALLAVLFNVVCVALEGANEMRLLETMSPLWTAAYSRVFDPGQLNAIAALSLQSYSLGFGMSLIFFGVECFVLGYLIYRSGYIPRAIGVMMAVAGGCYLVNSYSLILAPALASRLFPAIMLPVLVGEGALALWLLVKGADPGEGSLVPQPLSGHGD